MTVGEGRSTEVGDADARADEALSRFLATDAVPGVARAHRVTAFVLACDGAAWLPRCLAALQGQTRAADATVGIDAGSADDSGGLLSSAIPTTISLAGDPDDPAAAVRGMATALARGVAAVSDTSLATADTAPDADTADSGSDVADASDTSPDAAGASDAGPASDVDVPASDAESSVAQPPPSDPGLSDGPGVAWYWIVHDDCAPEPECLEALLLGADRHPGAAVLVPKTVSWSDRGRLVGVGNRWSPGKPIVERLEAFERDQGQYDLDRPVYAGDSAGMLVRADVWDSLGGIDPELGNWAGPADLCRRCWGMGAEVFFIPAAVVAHRRAGDRGVRREGQRPRAAMRAGQLILELSQAPGPALPWRYLRAWLATALRGLALLLTKEPEEAASELSGAWQVLGSPERIRRARQRARRPPVTTLKRPPQVRAYRGVALTHSLDVWSSAAGGSVVRPWWPPPTRVWYPLAVAGALAVAALVRDPSQLLGSGELRGGGLLPASGAMDLLRDYVNSWHDVGFGTGEPMPAYLPLLAAASIPALGSVDLVLRGAFGMALPLAFLSCYVSLGPGVAVRHRIPTALGYACLPAGVAASGGGRLSTLAVLLLAPLTARLIGRAIAGARGGPETGRVRVTLAAGTMLGVLVAFAPSVYLVVAVAAVIAWVVARPERWRVRTGATILAVSAGFLVLWAPRALAAPWLALGEVGVNDPRLSSPGPSAWGLAPGGPTSVAWAGVPLLVLAVVAVARSSEQRRSLVLLGAAVALLAAAAWLQPVVEWMWPEVGGGTVWPGAWLMLAGGILIVLVGRAAAEPAGSAVPGMTLAVAAAVGALVIGWWVAPRDLAVGTGNGIPPVASVDADSAARPRSLVLDRTEGGLRYAVAVGPTTSLGAADASAGQPVDPGFADAVAGLVSGASGAVRQQLGGRAVRYVVFNGAVEDPVVSSLDATVGLRQLARTPEQSLWLVTGDPSRAELDPPATAEELPDAAPIEVPVLTSPTSIDVVVHPQADLPRRLVVAEAADPGWRASASGVDLDLVPDAQGMLQATIDTPGDLRVEHRSFWPVLALAQLLAMVALIVISLPKQRPFDPDAAGEPGGTA